MNTVYNPFYVDNMRRQDETGYFTSHECWAGFDFIGIDWIAKSVYKRKVVS